MRTGVGIVSQVPATSLTTTPTIFKYLLLTKTGGRAIGEKGRSTRQPCSTQAAGVVNRISASGDQSYPGAVLQAADALNPDIVVSIHWPSGWFHHSRALQDPGKAIQAMLAGCPALDEPDLRSKVPRDAYVMLDDITVADWVRHKLHVLKVAVGLDIEDQGSGILKRCRGSRVIFETRLDRLETSIDSRSLSWLR
ncbi:MAG: hypothetical protein J3R72DRAFT_530826 [Linnemannia gamsii]|nr:MAG: hypothetical protein J3R72DRAFT_530826 [Linnemannia gamsii]